MSIIGFHRFLITTAILFCAVFAAWSFRRFVAEASATGLVLGIAFALAATALGYYLTHLARFLGHEERR